MLLQQFLKHLRKLLFNNTRACLLINWAFECFFLKKVFFNFINNDFTGQLWNNVCKSLVKLSGFANLTCLVVFVDYKFGR